MTSYYHGTNLDSAHKILRTGLKRRPKRRVWPGISKAKTISVTSSLRHAKGWAEIAARRFQDRPAVIRVNSLPKGCTVRIDPRRGMPDWIIQGRDIPPKRLSLVWVGKR